MRRGFALLSALWLAACATANFNLPGAAFGAAGDPDAYAARFPFYAEFCALSQIKKKPGFGADIRGEIGGHAVFYLNGACLVDGTGYPVLRVCDGPGVGSPGVGSPGVMDGVGLSMNAHFRNAKWVAIPGRRFFFHGTLAPNAPLTRAGYAATQAEAKRLGLYDAVEFWPEVFEAMPQDWIARGRTARDWKYEMSVGTDYATGFARGRYCARLPVTRAQMARMVDFLNEQNAPYRRREKDFHWSVFRDNCIHLAHNALAAAGVWDESPINRFILFAVFSFPVPKNEFVNVMRRTNDGPLLDLAALYRDEAARRSLLEFGQLPTRPGALAEAVPPQRPNEVYDTDVKLIFYDEPLFGSYAGNFDRIFSEPRYFDLLANQAYFAGLYARIQADRRPLAWWRANTRVGQEPDFATFYAYFYAYVDKQAPLSHDSGRLAGAAG